MLHGRRERRQIVRTFDSVAGASWKEEAQMEIIEQA